MKTLAAVRRNQRQIIDRKLADWLPVRRAPRPRSGWLKAIRESLGLTARQVAGRLGIQHAGVLRLEKREASGTATFDTLEKAARAMRCRVVYAIVPEDAYASLDAILDERALQLARKIAGDVAHTMSLEDQPVLHEDSELQIERLARALKETCDPRIWDGP